MEKAKRPLPGLVDLDGNPANPFLDTKHKTLVLLFVGTECPISNRYAPEIERLYQYYRSKDFLFRLIYPDADTSAEDILRHQREYHLTLTALRDPNHSLVKRARVRVTPESAVFLKDGRLAYHGCIDDRYLDFGQERPEAFNHILEDVLNAISIGNPITHTATKAIGCYISSSP